MNIKEILEQHRVWIETAGKNGSRANLIDTDFSYTDFSYTNLSRANLIDTDCSYTDFSYTNLSYADLSYTDCSYTDFSYADCSYTDFSYADCSYTDFSYADLRGADFRYANLRGAKLPDNTFIITGEKYFISINNGDHIRAGCRSYSIEKWRNFTKDQIAEMDGKNALRFYPRLLDIIDFYCGKGERPDWVKFRGVDNENNYD